MERQNEIDRLNRQKAKIEGDIEAANKKSKEYGKTITEREKATRELERLQRKLADEEQKRNVTVAGEQNHLASLKNKKQGLNANSRKTNA